MSQSIASSQISLADGVLYVVATPIGNLADITERALQTLSKVDVVLAEDTRRTSSLLQRYAINATSLQSFHEHNEEKLIDRVLARLQTGQKIALVSDAGTPLISDPGYKLVAKAHQSGIKVEAVPGCCAVTAALSVCGLPTDQFFFAGFLPAKSTKRIAVLNSLISQPGTLVFYESSHRIVTSLADCVDVLGDRKAAIAREITKLHETVHVASLAELYTFVSEDENQQKGEFVVLVESARMKEDALNEQELDRVLKILLLDMSVKQASSLAAKILDIKKNQAYQRALELK